MVEGARPPAKSDLCVAVLFLIEDGTTEVLTGRFTTLLSLVVFSTMPDRISLMLESMIIAVEDGFSDGIVSIPETGLEDVKYPVSLAEWLDDRAVRSLLLLPTTMTYKSCYSVSTLGSHKEVNRFSSNSCLKGVLTWRTPSVFGKSNPPSSNLSPTMPKPDSEIGPEKSPNPPDSPSPPNPSGPPHSPRDSNPSPTESHRDSGIGSDGKVSIAEVPLNPLNSPSPKGLSDPHSPGNSNPSPTESNRDCEAGSGGKISIDEGPLNPLDSSSPQDPSDPPHSPASQV